MKDQKHETITLEVDGKQYRWSENRLGKKTYTKAEVEAKRQSLESYLRRLHATDDDYTTVLVNGVEARMYTAGVEPTQEQINEYGKKVRDNIVPVRVETTTNDAGAVNGVRAVYYRELVDTPHAKATKLMAEHRDSCLKEEPSQDQETLMAEYKYLEALVEMLFEYKRYIDLVTVNPEQYGLGHLKWEHGKLNSREMAAMWAIDKVYRLDYNMDMMRGCGLGTLSNWLGVPYIMLIKYINKSYILNKGI